MSGRNTQELDISAARARCEAATPGPWSDMVGSIFEGEIRSCNDFTVIAEMQAFDDRPSDFEFIANARTDLPLALDAIAERDKRIGELERSVKELGEQLEFDRSAVAEGVTRANRAIDERHWLTEGRGCYEWNDDKWHEEFYAAAIEIKEAIEPLTRIAANWAGCPMKGEEVAAARVELKARLTAQDAEIEDLKAELETANEGAQFYNRKAADSIVLRESDRRQFDARIAELEREKSPAIAGWLHKVLVNKHVTGPPLEGQIKIGNVWGTPSDHLYFTPEEPAEQWAWWKSPIYLGGSARLSTALKVAREALEELSRLGNGNHLGNSIGNTIAQRALAAIKAAEDGA